jgi:hypothetical protein
MSGLAGNACRGQAWAADHQLCSKCEGTGRTAKGRWKEPTKGERLSDQDICSACRGYGCRQCAENAHARGAASRNG